MFGTQIEAGGFFIDISMKSNLHHIKITINIIISLSWIFQQSTVEPLTLPIFPRQNIKLISFCLFI